MVCRLWPCTASKHQIHKTGGETLKLLAYFIQYNGQIYKMVGLTANADFNIYFNNFQTSMRSFNKVDRCLQAE